MLRILVETCQIFVLGSQSALGLGDFRGSKSHFCGFVVGFAVWLLLGFGMAKLCLGQSTTFRKQKYPDVTKSWKVMAHVLETAVVLIWKESHGKAFSWGVECNDLGTGSGLDLCTCVSFRDESCGGDEVGRIYRSF